MNLEITEQRTLFEPPTTYNQMWRSIKEQFETLIIQDI